MKIRSKIIVIFLFVTATTLLLLSLFIYSFSLRNSHKYFFTRLQTRASVTLQAHGDTDTELRNVRLPLLQDEKEYLIAYDSEKRSWNADAIPALPQSFFDEVFQKGYAERENDFTHHVGIYEAAHPGVISVASAYDDEGEDQMKSLFNLLLTGFLLSCLFVIGLGRFLASQIIKPVSDIIAEVNHISAASLDKRLKAADGSDEIAALAKTFNSMLDRLHTAFEFQSSFINNASHELRTPLTTIIGESDFILSADRQQQQYINSIQTIQTEAEKLNELVESLLHLSKVEFMGSNQLLEVVSIDLLLMNIKSKINQRFPVNHLHIEMKQVPESSDQLELMCVPAWIELAFTNIINNAIKYSDNKDVIVSLSANEKELEISVADLGIGISEEDMRHVFELFFRGSNSKSYSGYGIGLPLADKIIRLHGGITTIVSKPGAGNNRYRNVQTMRLETR